jgi:hypothetical protein
MPLSIDSYIMITFKHESNQEFCQFSDSSLSSRIVICRRIFDCFAEKGSVGDRFALEGEAVANTIVGVPKVAGDAAALVVDAIGSETGVGFGVAVAGSYDLVQGRGQLESAGLQAGAAITGNITEVDEEIDRISATTTDSFGDVLSESLYFPYGGEQVISSGDSNTYKYTGKERDPETGNDNFGARY